MWSKQISKYKNDRVLRDAFNVSAMITILEFSNIIETRTMDRVV